MADQFPAHTPGKTTRANPEISPPGAVEDGSIRTQRRVGIRVFIYVIGLHLFAGSAILLYAIGQHRP